MTLLVRVCLSLKVESYTDAVTHGQFYHSKIRINFMLEITFRLYAEIVCKSNPCSHRMRHCNAIQDNVQCRMSMQASDIQQCHYQTCLVTREHSLSIRHVRWYDTKLYIYIRSRADKEQFNRTRSCTLYQKWKTLREIFFKNITGLLRRNGPGKRDRSDAVRCGRNCNMPRVAVRYCQRSKLVVLKAPLS